MNRTANILTTALFGSLFAIPVILEQVSVKPEGDFENRAKVELPEFRWDRALDIEYFREIEAYVDRNFPGRARIIQADSAIDYFVFEDSPNREVLMGRDGWLFMASSLVEAVADPRTEAETIAPIRELAELCAAKGVTFRFLMPPDKCAIYPEYLSDVARQLNVKVIERRDELRNVLRETPVPGYVDMWEAIGAAAEASEWPLFPPLGRHWDTLGAAALTESIVDSFEPGLFDTATLEVGRNELLAEIPARFMNLIFTAPRPKVLIRRPEVTVVGPARATTSGCKPSLLFRCKSAEARLVPGRTLVIHDSFMNLSMKSLPCFFENIAFLNWSFAGVLGPIDPNDVEAILATPRAEPGSPVFRTRLERNDPRLVAFVAQLFADVDNLIIEVVDSTRARRMDELRSILPVLRRIY
jgi:hypothetical protein